MKAHQIERFNEDQEEAYAEAWAKQLAECVAVLDTLHQKTEAFFLARYPEPMATEIAEVFCLLDDVASKVARPEYESTASSIISRNVYSR